MNKLTKVLALVLAVVMGLALVACDVNPKTEATEPQTETEEVSEYTKASREKYDAILGDFNAAYQEALKQDNLSKRFAMMAIAEAKLMEAAVMLPTTTRGGNYAISRVAPYTVDFALWGNDSDRYHQALVATEPLTGADRTEMKAKYNELKGTGTYLAWAKDYLAGKGYTLKDNYSLSYTSDPATWDALATSRAADSEAIVNTFDGLLEYDVEGTQKPALAESYTVSEDGLTYTFKLRQGVKWVDSQGREVADVKADDFVAGIQHSIDADGGLGYLVDGIIKNISAYISGADLDFTKVGVKAIDDSTLEYTLEKPCSYFLTMLGYNIFAPMSRSYYESKGGKFGADFDESAEDYTYGKSSADIAYNGPYLVTNHTEKNTIVFTANESYWNKDNINIKKITWLFSDGSDATKPYKDTKAGILDGAGLNSEGLAAAKTDGWFDKYGYISSTDATSYMAFFNINRAAFAAVTDASVAVTAQTPDDQVRTNKAMNNVHFRRAVAFSFDRAAGNAQRVGEDLKYNSLRNAYTPWNFVSLSEETTVSINGTDKTFKLGTPYGEIMQAQIDADGVKMTVYDPEADNGGDGFDGWYNADNAVEELNKAIDELDIEISAENPIYLDLPYPSNSTSYTNEKQAYKKSVEAALEGKVIINLVDCKSYDEWYAVGYDTNYGYEADYDIYDLSGWGPDYGDPQTYLDTFLPDYAGYMIKCIGIF